MQQLSTKVLLLLLLLLLETGLVQALVRCLKQQQRGRWCASQPASLRKHTGSSGCRLALLRHLHGS
jgi:hypothetical protein